MSWVVGLVGAAGPAKEVVLPGRFGDERSWLRDVAELDVCDASGQSVWTGTPCCDKGQKRSYLLTGNQASYIYIYAFIHRRRA